MADRENVIKALELCTSKIETRTQVPCEACSYHNTKYHGVLGDGCCNIRSLLRDCLSLLKAQEPRLVTKDDFKNADEYGWLPAWGEEKTDGILYCECILIEALKEKGIRYWTSRPTDAQMEATPWTQTNGSL